MNSSINSNDMHEEEVNALIEVANETGSTNGQARHQPQALAVFQDVETDSQGVQIALALATTRKLGLRVAILFRASAADELPAIRDRILSLDPYVAVRIITTEAPPEPDDADSQITLATSEALDKVIRLDRISEALNKFGKGYNYQLMLLPSSFDVIIISEGYTFRHEETFKMLATHFSQARLILAWTSRPPADEILAAHAKTTGSISIFDAKYMGNEFLAGGSSATPPPDKLEVVTLSLPSGLAAVREAVGRLFRAESTTGLRRTRKALKGKDERPHKELPPLAEMKLATISRIAPDEATAADVQPGMYIIVPQHFPNQCKVVIGTIGRYALIKHGEPHNFNGEEFFLVMPAPTVAIAEKLYEQARAGNKLPPYMISLKRNYTRDLARAEMPYPERLVCCCGATTPLYVTQEGKWLAGSPEWKFRRYESADIHLPCGWYCGQAGHYAETVETQEQCAGQMKFVVVRQTEPDKVLDSFEADDYEHARTIFRERNRLYEDGCLRRAEAINPDASDPE